MKSIFVYDTTLRDGSQGEKINFSAEDKLRIALKLDALGVHYIEGGWPGSNPKDVHFFELAKAPLEARGRQIPVLKKTQTSLPFLSREPVL